MLNPIDDNSVNSPPTEQVIRESSFHKALQTATLEEDKSSFNLILAMVTNDAKELDEFNLPHTTHYKTKSDIQKAFFVKGEHIYGKVPAERSIEQNQAIHQNFKTSVDLDLALKPEPLMAEKYDLPANVFDNLDYNSRIRLLNEVNTEEQQKPSSETQTTQTESDIPQVDNEAWFNTLHQARTFAAMA